MHLILLNFALPLNHSRKRVSGVEADNMFSSSQLDFVKSLLLGLWQLHPRKKLSKQGPKTLCLQIGHRFKDQIPVRSHGWEGGGLSPSKTCTVESILGQPRRESPHQLENPSPSIGRGGYQNGKCGTWKWPIFSRVVKWSLAAKSEFTSHSFFARPVIISVLSCIWAEYLIPPNLKITLQLLA